ncbi:hypothetical protein RB594_007908 [Gaeumannomyces avenae]
MEEPSLFTIAQTLAFPWVFMFSSLSCLPGTVARLAREGTLAAHLLGRADHGATLASAWFSDFWTRCAAPGVRANAGPGVLSLLAGRVRAGAVVGDDDDDDAGQDAPPPPPPHPPISGTVIEVGPGSGMWASALARSVVGGTPTSDDDNSLRRRRTTTTTTTEAAAPGGPVKRILGVEPNASAHAALRAAVSEAGLDGVYEVVPCGIEHLAASGAVAEGEVDCIVSILCLCSIPDPERNIRELYRYLKKGGRWYVYEHVCQAPGTAMYWYQGFVNLFWPHFIGGCRLRNETAKYLRSAGPWSDFDLVQPPREPWFNTLQHVLGILTK